MYKWDLVKIIFKALYDCLYIKEVGDFKGSVYLITLVILMKNLSLIWVTLCRYAHIQC